MYKIQDHYEPETVSQALSLLNHNEKLKVIAGGTDVLIKMHGGSLADIDILSIQNISVLKMIKILGDGEIIIGPLTTFSQLNKDPIINQYIPVLAEAAITMGGPQIRNIATIGGNICNGATSADSASTLFALNAKLKLESLKETRIVPIEEFYLGPGKVDLRAGELLTEIIIAQEDYLGFKGQYIKFSARNAMDIATLGVAAVCKVKEGKYFEDVRIGLGVAGPTPRRCKEAEEYAKGKEIKPETLKEIGRLAVKAAEARTSWRASKEYREHLVKELTQRALLAAIGNFGGEKGV